MLSLLTTAVNDTGSKVTAGVVDTGDKLTAGVVISRGKFSACWCHRDQCKSQKHSGGKFAAKKFEMTLLGSLGALEKMIHEKNQR